MTRTRRSFLQLATAQAAALSVLAACGGSGGSRGVAGSATVTTASTRTTPSTTATVKTSATSATTSQPSSPAAVKQGGKTLTLSGYGDTADVKARYDAVAAKFNEQFAGTYHLEPIINPFATYIDKTVTMLASGTPPDVFNTWAQYKPEWVQKGLLLDLSSHIHTSKDAAPDLYLKPMVDAMQYQGKFWGTAQDFNGELLFLNTDLFKAKGVDLPKAD